MNTVDVGWSLLVLVAGLAVAAAALTRLTGLGRARSTLTASARAVVQLAAVSLVIAAVIGSWWWTALFLAVMVAVASGTAAHRVTGSWRHWSWWWTTPVLAGVVPTLGAIVASGAVPVEPVAVLPIGGILIGGAMTAANLAGRRLDEELTVRRGAYDAALSLGLTRRAAVGVAARTSASLALVPGIDQTRTVGLVTLPGAFVGVLLAGAPPVQAGAAQVLVLVALLVVQVVAAAVIVELVSAGRLPVGGHPLPR